jgi:hypothetical protein
VAVEALWDAADDDSATGGPDVGRRIWPTVALIEHDGVRFADGRAVAAVVEASSPPRAATREVPDEPDALLRLARAADEGPGRLRAQGHRARPVGHRPRATPASLFVAENPSHARCTRSPRSTTGSGSPPSASTTSSRTFGSPGSVCRPARLLLRPLRRVGPGLANAYAQTLGTVFTQESKPYEVEIVVAEVGRPRGRPDLSAHLRRVGRRRARLRRHGRRPERSRRASRRPGRRRPRWRTRSSSQWASSARTSPGPAPIETSAPTSSRWPCSTGAVPDAPSDGSPARP